MARTRFDWLSLLVRLTAATALVFGTFNPTDYSYYNWLVSELPKVSPEIVFVGVVLLIGWVIFLRATARSLGALGVLLAVAFFGTLLWLTVDWGWLPADNRTALTYIILGVISAILGMGMSWSHIRRRLTGQADVDQVDEDV